MSPEKTVALQTRTVQRLLDGYGQAGNIPLARFLTGFYKRNRQMGGRDRRTASRLVYQYFRLGRAAEHADLAMRLAIAEFLCSGEHAFVEVMLPDLHPHVHADLAHKVALLEARTAFRWEAVFPFGERLSGGIDHRAFTESLFVQPDLFIRLRKRHADEVKAVLAGEGIGFRQTDDFTLALPNGTALGHLDRLSGKFEVQDRSSQQTAHHFRASAGERWWDACAGAGGKSLLLLDTHPGVDLLVSDVRPSILRNLDARFAAAGITSYRQKIVDLAKGTEAILGDERFDGIILDAPCTGSGTWGRTPEQISSFAASSIDRFAAVQKQLAGNAARHLKPGKPLVYITCSVFADENEGVVAELEQRHGLRLEHAELLAGYRHHRADSLFVARLVKP